MKRKIAQQYESMPTFIEGSEEAVWNHLIPRRRSLGNTPNAWIHSRASTAHCEGPQQTVKGQLCRTTRECFNWWVPTGHLTPRDEENLSTWES